MTRKFIMYFILVLCALAPLPLRAAEEAAAPQAKPEAQLTPEEQEKAREAKNAANKVYAGIKVLVEELSKENRKHFYIMYSSNNLISATKMVRKDVGAAIKSCGEKNPGMKQDLDAAHKTWADAVDPVIKEAELNLNNMVVAQDYAPQEKIQSIFRDLEDVREKTAARIEKIPVTTPEACEVLRSKMGETQEELLEALRSTLVSYARIAPPEDVSDPAKQEETKAP